MDVNKTQTITSLGSGGPKKEKSRDSGEEKQDKSQGEETADSPWEGTEAFAVDGLLADDLPPQIQKAIEGLTLQIEPLRAEVERARGREAHFRELSEKHSFLPVPGRREFFREMTHILAHMQGPVPPGLIVLHLGNADDIRRRHGREALDAMLAHVCDAIGKTLQPTDIFGSIGGNDLGVAVLVSDQEQIRQKARNLIDAIAAQPFSWQDHGVSLEVAAGVATLENLDTPEAALKAADADLIAGLAGSRAGDREDPSGEGEPGGEG